MEALRELTRYFKLTKSLVEVKLEDVRSNLLEEMKDSEDIDLTQEIPGLTRVQTLPSLSVPILERSINI